MERSPLISIVTVTYNAGHCLRKTMESVARQDFKDYEHLIVDGASKDDTLKIAEEYQGSNLRVVSEPDKGLYDAMNKGLRLAKGKYILFLNAGDSFSGDSVLGLYGRKTQNDMDIIYADTQIVDSSGKIIGPRHLSAPRKLTPKSFSKGMLICHQAFMVKKSLAPLYDLSYRFSSDYDWCVKCIANSKRDKSVNLDCVAINYLSDGLTDNNKIASLKERFRIMCRNYGFFPTLANHILFCGRALKRRFL